jgi:putative ATP-dependent endonuclease of OLD family
VLLVEGASEKALFNCLLATEWHDLTVNRLCVVDVFGKYNIHRFMALLEAFGIPHGVILDGDDGKEHHGAIKMI